MIQLRSLSRTWGGFSLRDLDIDIGKQEYFVILGPCGSGKTLLLETIAGLHAVDHGAIVINGRDVTHLNPEKRGVSLVYQQYALFPHLSIRANIAYGLRYRRLSRRATRERVDEMIDLLDIHDLAERNSPNLLSGGEAQKVALARALAVRPDVLLLDEPLTSLDPLARERVIEILRDIHQQFEAPIIHVTHDYFEATALADRAGVMHNGRLAQVGTVDDLFRRPDTQFVAGFLGVENVLDCVLEKQSDGICHVRVGNTVLRVRDAHRVNRQICLCIRPEDIRLHCQGTPPNALNCVSGLVKELRHDGFSIRIRVESGDGHAWIVVVPENQFATLAITAGMTVQIELPPDRLHLMRKDDLVHAA